MDKGQFTIKIADICVGIRPLNDDLERFFRDHIVSEEADFVIGTSRSDLHEERERIATYDDHVVYSDREVEKLWLQRQVAEKIPQFGAFLIHATSVRVDDDAYLFLGPSGAGKTTHAKLWEEYFADRLWAINDDKPIVKVKEDEIMICGSPWSGKERWKNNISAPLHGIIWIEQAGENRIEVMPPAESWDSVMNQVYRSRDPKTMKRILDLAGRMIESTRLFRLECNREIDAVRVAFEEVSKRG